MRSPLVRAFTILVVSTAFPGIVWADEIHLKSGKVLRGAIFKEDADFYYIRLSNKKVRVKRENAGKVIVDGTGPAEQEMEELEEVREPRRITPTDREDRPSWESDPPRLEPRKWFWTLNGGYGSMFSGLGGSIEGGYEHIAGFFGAGYFPGAALGSDETGTIEVSSGGGVELGGKLYLRNGEGLYLGFVWGFVAKTKEQLTSGKSSSSAEKTIYGPSGILGWQWRFGTDDMIRFFIDGGISYVGDNPPFPSAVPTLDIGFGIGSGNR